MVLDRKRIGALSLRLIVGLALLGCARMGSAQGTWSVISLPQKLGEVSPGALAVDTTGNLYVADYAGNGQYRIEKRDAQGNWSLIATEGGALGQVDFFLGAALAVDTADNLYVAEGFSRTASPGRIQKRDAQGNWSVIAASGTALGQVSAPRALAVDTAGSLYVAVGMFGGDRIQKRDAQGNWLVIAPYGPGLGQVDLSSGGGLAVDTASNLYVAEDGNSRVQKYTPNP